MPARGVNIIHSNRGKKGKRTIQRCIWRVTGMKYISLFTVAISDSLWSPGSMVAESVIHISYRMQDGGCFLDGSGCERIADRHILWLAQKKTGNHVSTILSAVMHTSPPLSVLVYNLLLFIHKFLWLFFGIQRYNIFILILCKITLYLFCLQKWFLLCEHLFMIGAVTFESKEIQTHIEIGESGFSKETNIL